MDLPGYRVPPPPPPNSSATSSRRSRRAGGRSSTAAAAWSPPTPRGLREFATKTGIPVAMTLQGLGAMPSDHYLSLGMLGMHGTVYSNYAISEADLLLAFGVRFDDRVTGKLSEFAKHGRIIHVDIDASEINKNKTAHIRGPQRHQVVPRGDQSRRSTRRLARVAPADRRLRASDPMTYDRATT